MTSSFSNFEEVDLIKLPEEEQVSDDFILYECEGEYYAVRDRHSTGGYSFCFHAGNKQTLIAKAVAAIHWYIEKGNKIDV